MVTVYVEFLCQLLLAGDPPMPGGVFLPTCTQTHGHIHPKYWVVRFSSTHPMDKTVHTASFSFQAAILSIYTLHQQQLAKILC